MKKIYYVGLMVGMGLVLLLPSLLAGDMASNGTVEVSGFSDDPVDYSTEDPYTSNPQGQGNYIESKRPELDSYEQYTVISFTCEYSSTTNIRLAITNGGAFTFTWILGSATDEVVQDYSDVQVFYDEKASDIRAVVVWQERPVDGGDWEIKAVDYSLTGGTWSNVLSITNNDVEDLHPKVSVFSYPLNPTIFSYTYWNVVWEAESLDYATHYGVNLWRYVRYDNPTITFTSTTSLATPASANEDYLAPATDCVGLNTYSINLYVVYFEHHANQAPWYVINLNFGSYTPQGAYAPMTTIVDTADQQGDYVKYPDVTVIEETDDSVNGADIVDLAWISYKNSVTSVISGRSFNGGNSVTLTTVVNNGVDGIRNVAIDSYRVSSAQYYSAVMFATTSNLGDVHYKIKINNLAWGSLQNAGVSGYNEDFVDITILQDYQTPTQINTYGTWERGGTKVMFGYDTDL